MRCWTDGCKEMAIGWYWMGVWEEGASRDPRKFAMYCEQCHKKFEKDKRDRPWAGE